MASHPSRLNSPPTCSREKRGGPTSLFLARSLVLWEKYEDAELVQKKKSIPKKKQIFLKVFFSSQHLSILTSSTDGPEDLYENLTDCLSIYLSIRAVCKHVPFQRLQQSSISGTIVGIRILCLCEGGLMVLSPGNFSGTVWISFLVFCWLPSFGTINGNTSKFHYLQKHHHLGSKGLVLEA
jgi:hypothetical protein